VSLTRSQPITAGGPWRAGFGVFLAASVWAAVVLVFHGYHDRPPYAEENNIALHLERGDGFLSPVDPSPNAAPTSWSPPLYPVLIAAAYRRWGEIAPPAVTALLILNAACFGAVAAGLCVLGRTHFSSAAGWLAAGLFAIHPLFLFFVGDFWDTYLALALFIWILIIVAPGVLTPGRASILGAAFGLLSLTNASYLFSYPLILWHGSRNQPRDIHWKRIALAVLSFCVVLTPWTIRNALEFHRLMYVRGGAEFEMWLGNRPGATGLLNDPTLADHPYKNGTQRALLIKIGEMEYFHRCREMFLGDLRDNPMRIAKLSVLRAWYLLWGNPKPPPHAIPPLLSGVIWKGMIIQKVAVNILTTLLGLGGIILACRRSPSMLWLAAAGALAVAPFVISSVTDRYGLPLWAIFLVFGGYLIASIFQPSQGALSGGTSH
jgi:hypothetical protein